MPLRIPDTNIHFYKSGTLIPKMEFKDLQFPYCLVLPLAVLCICPFLLCKHGTNWRLPNQGSNY